jgi:DNA-directed RNA polymerase specialized sigma24 family protein
MSRPPLVRRLTDAQQAIANEALAVMPDAIAAFWRGHPCLRKYKASIDSVSAAMTAITLASFCFDASKSKMTTYFTVAIRNELRKEVLKEQRRREESSHRHAHSAPDPKPSHPEFGLASECMDSLDEYDKHLVYQSVVVGRRITELARQQRRDPRTVQRHLDAALEQLRDCVASSSSALDSLDREPAVPA